MVAEQPRIVLHVLPPSHPCVTVEAALRIKGLHYERVELHVPEPALYPAALSDAVSAAARWVDEEPR
jgi:hypothetical protein